MIKRTFNRLWVRFGLSIVVTLFVVSVLPASLVFLIDPQEIFLEVRDEMLAIDQQYELNLSPQQIDELTQTLSSETQKEFLNDFQYLTITTLIVGTIGGLILGRGLTLPIERLVAGTKAVGSRDLTYRVEVRGAQEIQDLAENFNLMTAELARSEEMRRNMMADVSHELLTPLTVLQGNLRAILEGVYELNKDEIGTLYEQNKHLIRLVRDLRQLAQAEAGQLPFQMTQVDLAHLVSEAVAFFLPAVEEKQISLKHDLAENLPLVTADGDRIRQVLHNLLANALRHTPEKGEIAIRLERSGEDIQIVVADNGEGIEPQLLPNVFERFYRTNDGRRRDSGGAGLGLAISKAIVEAHHGRLEVSSPGVNQGSVFSVCLPIAAI
ncbi:MAG: ATP-binding protein [Ardenticatenaceae bacterium]|nr:ATP-binding protein [Ardenticatenaceae bacterium]